jgi:hypothetical protein
MFRLFWMVGFAILGGVAVVIAQPNPIPVKPPVDPKAQIPPKTDTTRKTDSASLVSGFRSFIAFDQRFDPKDERNRQGKLHCVICEHDLNPVLGVFSRGVPQNDQHPIIPLFTKMELLSEQHKSSRLGSFGIFLVLSKSFQDDETREQRIAEVANVGRVAKLKTTILGVGEFALTKDDATQPNPALANFGIGDKDHITVIFYNRMKVIKRWAFEEEKPPTDNDIKAISDEVERVLKPKKK